MTALVCWRCGASLQQVSQPFARLAQCKACDADLHVCRLCKFYNPRHSDKCDHELAEPAREVDVANFCHYFRPQAGAHNSQEKSRADDALVQLQALFADNDAQTPNSQANASPDVDAGTDKPSDKDRFDALFKKD